MRQASFRFGTPAGARLISADDVRLDRLLRRASSATVIVLVIISLLLAGCDPGLYPTVPAEQAAASAPPQPPGQIALNFARPSAPAPALAPPADTARYPDARPEPVRSVAEQPVSTFSIDVDTASYAVARRFLRDGRLPPPQAVRVEEMVNYFRYDYAAPADREQPFRTSVSVLPTPWNAETRLLHIAIRGYDVARRERPRLNLVLLVDVSGSMTPDDRLPLLKRAFARFADELRPDDRIAIVTYASGVGVALEPTAGQDRDKIARAIAGLRGGGATAGAAGLQTAYDLAERHFDPEAVNRVILATDGDFNVGISEPRRLEAFIAAKRKTGLYLSVLGVGLDNLNDALMQRLAQAGNGNAAHIDSMLEARKVLIDELASTMVPIANDVKIQVEFNPATVAEYRLIGYETRALRREDFNDDRVDAGDIGAGHSVTALYEITPAGSRARLVDPLRYGEPAPRLATAPKSEEYAFVRLRYKLPGAEASRLIETPVPASELRDVPPDMRFATAVAAFGQKLRGEGRLDGFAWRDIAALANAARGEDPLGLRTEFVQLVRAAEGLKPHVAR